MPIQPFASLAFLSGLPATGSPWRGAAMSAALWPIDPSRPGAGLWPIDPSRRSAGLWPIDPAWSGAGLWPIDPSAGLWPIDPSSGLWPIDPRRRSAAQWPSNPPHAPRPQGGPPQPTAAPAPGMGAQWADEQSMLSQALRKSRARIVRSSDAPETAARMASQALWRWAPDSRVKTVSCQLIQRFQVHERALWLTAPLTGAAARQGRPKLLYPLPKALQPKQLEDQVDKVLRAAVEREDRLPEILAQAPDFQPFFDSITGIATEQAPRLSELIAVMQDAAVHLVMLLKHEQAARRPVQASSRVMPVIATPGHGSLPSGHATMAALTSELLYLLLYKDGARREQRAVHLDRLARRIAFNRVVAGVHFPADSKAGYVLGTLLARTFASMAGALPEPSQPASLQDVGGADLDLPEIPKDGAPERPEFCPDNSYKVAEAPVFKLLWEETRRELAKLRV